MKAASASAPGDDRVSFRALKLINQRSGEVLAQLYNKCILRQWAPEEWLSATVKALFKLGATATTEASLNPANYRGISLLSCIRKTIERIIDTRMREFLQHFGIADGAQGEFKAHWGTPMQTLTLEEALLSAGEDAPACFIDTRKAFPSVEENRLSLRSETLWARRERCGNMSPSCMTGSRALSQWADPKPAARTRYTQG